MNATTRLLAHGIREDIARLSGVAADAYLAGVRRAAAAMLDSHGAIVGDDILAAIALAAHPSGSGRGAGDACGDKERNHGMRDEAFRKLVAHAPDDGSMDFYLSAMAALPVPRVRALRSTERAGGRKDRTRPEGR